MKKIFTLTAIAFAALTLASACSSKKDNSSAADGTDSIDSAPTEELAAWETIEKGFVAPKFEKLLLITSKGVDVYEEPSSQSRVLGKGPEVLLLLEENEEWYCGFVGGEDLDVKVPAYVMKAGCNVKEPRELTTSYLNKDGMGNFNSKVYPRTGGQYDGLAVIPVTLSYGGGATLKYLFLGTKVGNVYVGKHIQFTSNDADDGVSFHSSNSDDERTYNVSYKQLGISYPEEIEGMKKLNDTDIENILALTNKYEADILYANRISFDFGAENGACPFTIDLRNYKGETVTYFAGE